MRKIAKEKRKSLDIKGISEKICSHIRGLEAFSRAQNVLLFYPKEFEINLLELCSAQKNFYLPRVEGERLVICPYDCNVKLERSKFNVLEPCSAPVEPQKIDLALLPCLMADRKKFRLGYGGGFYDRFLKTLRPNCTKIAVLALNLLVDALPVEEFDQPVDYVITENGLI